VLSTNSEGGECFQRIIFTKRVDNQGAKGEAGGINGFAPAKMNNKRRSREVGGNTKTKKEEKRREKTHAQKIV